MASEYVQLVGEARYYQQNIVNDTIASASWTVDSTDMTLGTSQRTNTNSTVLATALETGSYVLSCTIVTTGGQTLIGEVRIRVVETIV